MSFDLGLPEVRALVTCHLHCPALLLPIEEARVLACAGWIYLADPEDEADLALWADPTLVPE